MQHREDLVHMLDVFVNALVVHENVVEVDDDELGHIGALHLGHQTHEGVGCV